jgi:hypothetical protein
MVQIVWLRVASKAVCGEITIIPGLVGDEVPFMSSKLVKAATCELVQLHKVMWFQFWSEIVVFWCGECIVLECAPMLNCMGFCDGEGGEEVSFRVVQEEKSFMFGSYHINRQWLRRGGVREVRSLKEVGATSERL